MSTFKSIASIIAIGAFVAGLNMALVLSRTPEAPKTSQAPAAKSLKLGSIVRLVRNGHTFCSGTVVSPHIIITAAHCVTVDMGPFGVSMDTDPIEIRADDNVSRGVIAKAYFATAQMDQALLTGDFNLFEPRLCITDPTQLTAIKNTVGASFLSCGYPLGGDLYCAVTTFAKPELFFWAVNGTLYPGMSGGPTMTQDGAVVGVNCAVQGPFSLISPIYNLNHSFEAPKSK